MTLTSAEIPLSVRAHMVNVNLEKHGERGQEICFQKRKRFCDRELYLKLSPTVTLSRKSCGIYFQKSQGAFASEFAPTVPVMSIHVGQHREKCGDLLLACQTPFLDDLEHGAKFP